MEYVYAALLLHKSEQKITEESMKKVLDAAGAKVDEARIKTMVAALEGVNIDEEIKKAVPVATAAGPAQATKEAEKTEEEEKKSEEEAAAGLGALFG
jgi:large subunit ribosomal protein L12